MPGARLKHPLFMRALALSLSATLIALSAISALPFTVATNADAKKDALKLVSELLKSAADLKSPSNRIKLRSRGMVLLVASDPNLARRTCQEIESDFAELFSVVVDDADSAIHATDLLRAETVRSISDVDPTMALQLLRNTGGTGQRKSAEGAPDDAELETYVAAGLVDKDPRRAYEVIRSSQSGTFFPLLPELLKRLEAQDVGMARDAANGLADSLINADLAGRQDAFFTAIGLINVGHTITGDRVTGREQAGRLLTREKEAVLLSKLVAAATGRGGAANGLPMQLAGLLPIVAEVAPESARALRREFESSRQKAGRMFGGSDFWERVGDRNVAEAVGLIGAEPEESRGVLYGQAASRAMACGDTTLAKGIAERFIVNQKDRQEILREIGREEVLRAVDSGDVTPVRWRLAQGTREERARLLLDAANRFGVEKGAKQPLRLLEEARVALSGQPRNVAQLNLRLQLAAAFMRFEDVRAGDTLEAVVTQLNEVLSAAAALDGYLSDGPIIKDGELDLSNGSAIIGVYLTCLHDLASLAKYDYYRAEAIADEFERPEAKMMAKLLVAEGVLSS